MSRVYKEQVIAGRTIAYLPSADVYSMEETVVGRWIDGKPIYRRTIITTAIGATTNELQAEVDLVDCSGMDIDAVTEIKTMLLSPAGSYMNDGIDGWSTAAGTAHFYKAYMHPTKKIRERCNTTGFAGYTVYITLEYTKTTDTATIEIPDAAAMQAAYEEGVQSA